jgi:hypothetical protein
MTDHKIAQLSDIVADWCGSDLERIGHNRPVQVDAIAQEVVRCMLFTLTQDLTARKLFMAALMDDIEELRRAHTEGG